MSEIRQRRQRVEVGRNRAALLDAAMRTLAERPEAGMAEIAQAAGMTRQTAYVHFGTREALLAAVRDEVSHRALATLDAASLDTGTATEALGRFLDAAGTLLGLPAVPGPEEPEPGREELRHKPVQERLEALIARGRATGEFVTELDTGWLVTATIALGHAADQQVRADQLDTRAAAHRLRLSVLRLYGVQPQAPEPR